MCAARHHNRRTPPSRYTVDVCRRMQSVITLSAPAPTHSNRPIDCLPVSSRATAVLSPVNLPEVEQPSHSGTTNPAAYARPIHHGVTPIRPSSSKAQLIEL